MAVTPLKSVLDGDEQGGAELRPPRAYRGMEERTHDQGIFLG